MSEFDLRAEIDALRREIAALRAERAPADQVRDGQASTANDGGFAEQMGHLAHEMSIFAEDMEKRVVNHPLSSVLGALALGILIGRAIPR